MPERMTATSIVSNITATSIKWVADNSAVDGGGEKKNSRIDLQSLTLVPHVNGDEALLQQLSPRLMQEYKDYQQLIDESIFRAMTLCASIAETSMSARAITKSAIATAVAALIIEDIER